MKAAIHMVAGVIAIAMTAHASQRLVLGEFFTSTS